MDGELFARLAARCKTMRPLLLALGMSVAATGWAVADTDSGGPQHADPETRLLSALSQINSGKLDGALEDLSSLIEEQPDFRLANYLYGDLMLAKAGRIPNLSTTDDEFGTRKHALLEEARSRWSHRLQSPPANAVPNAVLALAPSYRYVVVVDLKRNRLYLLKNVNGVPKIQADYYASIGEKGIGKYSEGDAKTPVGVYHVTEYKSDRELPELYGVGAFPVNYPNELDLLYGRTGYGIWVHGVPRDTYNRAPRASQGCVVVSNEDLEDLHEYIQPGVTPVVFTDQLEWLTPEEAAEKRWELVTAVADWRRRWEQVDTEGYLGYYSAQFVSNDGMDKQSFSEYKRQVNANKTAIDVKLDDISIFRYPSEQDMALITFTQRYSSNNFHAVARKQQFWKRDSAAGWQILHESRGE